MKELKPLKPPSVCRNSYGLECSPAHFHVFAIAKRESPHPSPQRLERSAAVDSVNPPHDSYPTVTAVSQHEHGPSPLTITPLFSSRPSCPKPGHPIRSADVSSDLSNGVSPMATTSSTKSI